MICKQIHTLFNAMLILPMILVPPEGAIGDTHLLSIVVVAIMFIQLMEVATTLFPNWPYDISFVLMAICLAAIAEFHPNFEKNS